jgi:hypothetical protein
MVMPGDKQMATQNEIETYQMIESLILNADAGEIFGGLGQRAASRYQHIAWVNGRGISIEVENSLIRTYRALVVF